MDTIIQTESLTKTYADINVAEAVSLHVRKGEIYGFLGLNGAGKTTTIRMLLGMIQPTSGKAWLFGKETRNWEPELWNKVGYLVENPSAYPNLTVEENLQVISKLRYLRGKEHIHEVISLLGLQPYTKKKARHLSLGNFQRLGLAKALIHKPELLILDEPTNGLDPAGITEIRNMLLELAHNQGCTIFVSSHILGEVARFASRIGIIHNGKLIQELNTEELEKQCRRSLAIQTKNNPEVVQLLSEKGIECEISGDGIIRTTNNKALCDPGFVSSLLVHSGFPPSLIMTEEEGLESYFLRTIGMKGGKQ